MGISAPERVVVLIDKLIRARIMGGNEIDKKEVGRDLDVTGEKELRWCDRCREFMSDHLFNHPHYPYCWRCELDRREMYVWIRKRKLGYT